MALKIRELNIDLPVEVWYEQLFKNIPANDFIVTSNNADVLRWFGTNLSQFLSRIGYNEIVPLYGKHIVDLESFCCQANLILPVGFKMRADYDALQDLLLNFESEPHRRIIIWNDAHFLFNNDRATFERIFETMVVAAYCNRLGISTIKEDGSRYKVDQRNVFIFDSMELNDVRYLLEKEYFITSIDEPNLYETLDFNVIGLIENDENNINNH